MEGYTVMAGIDDKGRTEIAPFSKPSWINFISTKESAIGASFENVGDELPLRGASAVLAIFDITPKDSTEFYIQGLLRRASEDVDFIEQKIDSAGEVYSNRNITLSGSGKVYCYIMCAGFEYLQIQAKFTTSGTAGDIESGYARLIA